MKKLKQTRLHNPPESMGNCFPTVIACFLDLNSPEDVLQIQEKHEEDDWNIQIYNWLYDRGWEWSVGREHLYDDSYYLVSGKTERGTQHVCIYQNGKLYHDPHPSDAGLVEETGIELLIKL